MEKVSISSGSISVILRGIPSTKTRGVEAAELLANVLIPRIQNSASSNPGSLDRCIAIRPETCPARLLVRFLVGAVMSETLTELMDTTTLSFFCCPYPTTTTSSSAFVSSRNLILMFRRSLILTSSVE